MFDWAQVKYLEEDVRATVPTSFFKVVVDNLRRPDQLEVGETYCVFWSSVEDETPMDILAEGNDIIDIEDLPELERRRRKTSGPLKGYYNALLLSLSNDEDVERQYKRELSESNCLPSNVKRTKVPSAKAIEAKKNSDAIKKGLKLKGQSGAAPDAAKDKASKPAILEATKRNLTAMFVQASKSSHSSKKAKLSCTSDPDPDFCLEDEIGIKDKRKSHDKTNDSKLNDSKKFKKFEKFEKFDCQKKKDFLGKDVKGSTSKEDSEKKRKLVDKKNESKQSNSFRENRDKSKDGCSSNIKKKETPKVQNEQATGLQNVRDEMYKELKAKAAEYAKHCPSDKATGLLALFESPVKDQIKQVPLFLGESPVRDCDNEGYETFSEIIDKQTESSNKDADVSDDDLDETVRVNASDSDVDDSSSDDEVVVVKRRLTTPARGQGGDSAAVFNFCSSLWKPEELVIRSPTGLPPSCRKGAAAYPKMTPEKVNQCRDFLKNRILEEDQNTPTSEIEHRVNRLGYILGQKISSTRKSLRAKKISWPTAEELQEEKRRRKEARRQRRLRLNNNS